MWAWALPAIAWLKKWWKWLALPIGVGLWLLGRMTAKKTVTVVSPELVEHVKVVQKLDAKAMAEVKIAEVVRDKQIDVVNQDYDTVIRKMDEADERKKKALESDPVALNKFLKEVGARVTHRS